MDVIYSRSRPTFGEGAAYRNPRYFVGVEADAETVYIVGDYPVIAQAYGAEGIEVRHVDPSGRPVERAAPQPVHAPADLTPAAPSEERGEVAIPERWQDMAWRELRALAATLSQEPVLNRKQALAVVAAEVERRATEAPSEVAETGEAAEA